jgi:hypothetical protein
MKISRTESSKEALLVDSLWLQVLQNHRYVVSIDQTREESKKLESAKTSRY